MRRPLALLLLASAFHATPAIAQPVGDAAVVQAARSFLATLTADQRRRTVYAFDDETQRARWSNFPSGVVPRGGLSLKEMEPAQRDAATALLAVVLSPAGLQKVDAIRDADDDFKVNGSKRGPGGRAGPGGTTPGAGRGGGAPPTGGDLFGRDLYYLSFVGEPSTAHPWMLQFGGHHLALNITISNDRQVLTPTLTGAQPAHFVLNGKTVRPLGRESDRALALLRSLDDRQRRQAILGYQVADLVLGPGQDGKTIVPDGLKASDMNVAQRALLLDLIAEWAGIVNRPAADARMATLATDLDGTWFAWSGSTTGDVGSNITAYYRIQGPHLVIEYAPQNDEPDNHVHTMYRDPTDDYGRPAGR